MASTVPTRGITHARKKLRPASPSNMDVIAEYVQAYGTQRYDPVNYANIAAKADPKTIRKYGYGPC